MKRVLIVNTDGLLAALPTEQEYLRYSFEYGNIRVLGFVSCSDQVVETLYKKRARVRLLLECLPKPDKIDEQWLWATVVNGELVLIHSKPTDTTMKRKSWSFSYAIFYLAWLLIFFLVLYFWSKYIGS